jgi:glucose/arabinose dehydrogenase
MSLCRVSQVLRAGCLAALLMFAIAAPAEATQLVKVGGFAQPTYVTAPPGDASRLFVTQQPGKIQVMVGGHTQAAPFLDLTAKVKPPGSTEQGLLSMAFAPDYVTSGKFYVYYTSRNCPSSPGCDNHVSEFRRSAGNPNVADPASERVLLVIPHPGDTNHNGGQLQFGPDGFLYVSTGDGGGNNDSHQNAQKRNNLLGKILRIDPSRGSPYAIPPGNPFGGSLCSGGSSAGATCPEIWAYGLRNPWRFSFDRATGDLAIGDVGEGGWEEVDFAHPGQNAGANYGWPCFEGNHAASSSGECSPRPTAVTGDVWEYPHSCNSGHPFCGAGIIGGYVVRDPSLTGLTGRYIYGDLSKSGLRSVVLGQPAAAADAAVGASVSTLSSFGEDAAGCVYAASVGNGAVYRIAPDASPTPGPCALPSSAPAPVLQAKLTARKRQRILRSKRLKFSVTPNSLTTVVAHATITVSRRHAHVLKFHGVTRHNVTAGKRHVLRLRLSRRSQSSLRKLLRRRGSLVAKVVVTVSDGSGGSGTLRKAIRLIR